MPCLRQPARQLDKDIEEEAITEEGDPAVPERQATPELHVSEVLVLALGLAGFPPVWGDPFPEGDVFRIPACSVTDVRLYIFALHPDQGGRSIHRQS